MTIDLTPEEVGLLVRVVRDSRDKTSGAIVNALVWGHSTPTKAKLREQLDIELRLLDKLEGG